jgi:hypothetical protein
VTVGFPLTKDTVDSRAGQLAVLARDLFREVNDLKLQLDAFTAQQLVDGMAYTLTEANTLKSAMTDLYNLGQVANGLATQTPANNFLFWSSKLVGPN